MDDKIFPVDPARFRSALVPAAAVLYALAGICGLGGVALLADPGSRAALTEDIVLSGILDQSARSSWQLIHTVIGCLAFLCPALLSVGLTITLKGPVHKGMTLLHGLAKGLHLGVAASGAAALALLIFRLGRYILMCLSVNEGAYLIYTLLMSEAIMVAQAYLLHRLLRRFLRDARECAASIGYTLSAGALDSTTYPGFVSTGMLILGIVCMVIAADRFLTLTIVDSFPADYYAVLLTKDLIQIFTGSALLLGGAGNILLSAYIRRFKRIAERMIYNRRKQTLGNLR